MGEHTKYQMEYIESVDGCAHQSAVDIIGALEQRCDELTEALDWTIQFIDTYAKKQSGPATPELNKARAALAKMRGEGE